MTVTSEELEVWKREAEEARDQLKLCVKFDPGHTENRTVYEDQRRILTLITALQAKDQRIAELENICSELAFQIED